MTHRLFVLGGARSGKSRYAQARAEEATGRHVFIATAQSLDAEMDERIARHRADRDARWTTVDAPHTLPEAIAAWSGRAAVVLVDCLTLWTSNLLLDGQNLSAAGTNLCATIREFDGTLVLVSNEVGWGIVPDNALARRFRDEAGRINQAVAAAVDEAVLVVAGLPLPLKSDSTGRPRSRESSGWP